jgi:3-methyladenine DNA glycosylase AlkD
VKHGLRGVHTKNCVILAQHVRLNMQTEDLFSEIVKQLEKLAKSHSSKVRLQWFSQQHKETGLKSYGIRTPEIRKLIKAYTSRLKQPGLKEKYDLAKRFYKSGFFEQATFGDTLLELSAESITPMDFDLLDETVGHFNNWASVDWLCLRVLQPLLLKYREETLKLLEKWNRSENMWKRRASVVAFVRKIGSSGEFTDIVIEFCDNLVWDEEDLVLKGVGWALKDNLIGAGERVLDYVKSLRRRGVSSLITLYAIRDLKGKKREEVLKIKPNRKPERI